MSHAHHTQKLWNAKTKQTKNAFTIIINPVTPRPTSDWNEIQENNRRIREPNRIDGYAVSIEWWTRKFLHTECRRSVAAMSLSFESMQNSNSQLANGSQAKRNKWWRLSEYSTGNDALLCSTKPKRTSCRRYRDADRFPSSCMFDWEIFDIYYALRCRLIDTR